MNTKAILLFICASVVMSGVACSTPDDQDSLANKLEPTTTATPTPVPTATPAGTATPVPPAPTSTQVPYRPKIAFSSNRDGNYEIYVMDVDASPVLEKTNFSTLRRLTETYWDERRPSWSPNGARIIFAARRSGEDTEIYLMSANGSNVMVLTDNHQLGMSRQRDEHDREPSWEPAR